MANRIKIKKGLNIPLMGKSEKIIRDEIKSEYIKLCPEDFEGITPKPSVKEGYSIKAGEPLFFDKTHRSIFFASPVSGEVTAIERGEKRKILNFTVKADKENKYKDFGKKSVPSLSAEEIKKSILDAGIWWLIKQRPYDVVANPEKTPRDIFVTGFSTTPLAPSYDFILQERENDLQTGFDALAKMTAGKIYLGINSNTTLPALKKTKNVIVTKFDGVHPAGNVGVQINKTKPVNQGETVWTLNAIDVAVIGKLFNKGIVDLTRVIALSGSEVKQTGYYKMLIGTQLTDLFKDNVHTDKNLRFISGDVLSGRKVEKDGVLRAYASQVTVIPEGNDTHEMFGWALPGFNKYSAGCTYPSRILQKIGLNKTYRIDARLQGGHRAIIMSNEYDKVFPMNILSEYLLKAIIAFDIDRMEQLGIYEVAPEDFALCEFVDTSKLQIQRIVRTGLDMLRKEVE